MKKEKNKQITTKKPKNGLNIEELFFQLENDNFEYENNKDKKSAVPTYISNY